jgi:hypothetical protein
MVAKRKTTAKKPVRQQPEPKAATTLFRVVCLIGAITLLLLDAIISTFDYPVWVLGILMGIVIGLSPDDIRDYFRRRG